MSDADRPPNQPSQEDITQWLVSWGRNGEETDDRLMEAVYQELHRLAESYMRGERHDHTLQPTALVHEAYMRLSEQKRIRWQNRAHFFGIAALQMRRILLKHARQHRAVKRGAGVPVLSFDPQNMDLPIAERSELLIAVDEALIRLEAIDPRQVRLVELRYFAGYTIEETAEILGTSTATVKREWRLARAWLTHALGGDQLEAAAAGSATC